ncbi:MAG: OmpA family protein [Flavobacterium sp.]
MIRILILFYLISYSASAQEQFSVFFDSNQFNLSNIEKAKLLQWVQSHQKDKVVAMEGFTDEDGSIGYNDTLSKKRVQSVWNELKDKIQIREDFKTRSFGKLHQQDTEKSKNRRVTITYILEKDLERENEILGIIPIVKEKVAPKFPDALAIKEMDGSESILEFDVAFMQKVSLAKQGETFLLESLNFHWNTFAITKESRPKLYELLFVMQQNPNLRIKVIGHMCCNASAKTFQLSKDRAKAIKQFLIANGIKEERVTFEGKGIQEPLFAIPETDEGQRAANRRVEIFIVENP